MNPRHLSGALLFVGFTSVAFAQTNCVVTDTNISYRVPPLSYPMTSDQYTVQYQLDGGGWTDAPVRISYYGGTDASPSNSASGYLPGTSISFVSIPALASTAVQLRVTKLSSGFLAGDNVSVRPRAKRVDVTLPGDGTVNLSTSTASNFAGDQFLLWWSNDTNGSRIEALVFFLDPPYAPPTGNVKIIAAPTDLTNLNNFDTLLFQGAVALGGTGDVAYNVPTNITTIFLSTDAWVQGKLRFKYSGGVQKRVYGPGVLDGSRFRYDLRTCDGDQGYHSLSWANLPTNTAVPDTFVLDGIVITDHNHATDDLLVNGVVNNVKTIGWNGLNGGFRLGDNTKASNVFLRSGDDSLMMWGSNVFVTNATVWQNYNGAPVNLGWGDKSPGDNCLIDGLYVVRTDWHSPNHTSFTNLLLAGQNNAIITSLMVPGTLFGNLQPPLFRNIFVEDSPQTLFSLKILFPECSDPSGPRDGDCGTADLTLPSVLNLNIENFCAPVSVVSNLIGFQTVPANFTYEFPAGTTNIFTNSHTFTGSMNIGLTNVILTLADGIVTPLTAANAAALSGVVTSGTNVQVTYGFVPNQCIACLPLPQLSIISAGANVVLTWPTNVPGFTLEKATNLVSSAVWKTNSTAPIVINGLNVVTNPISGTQTYYRLKY